MDGANSKIDSFEGASDAENLSHKEEAIEIEIEGIYYITFTFTLIRRRKKRLIRLLHRN
jgi:hypothetical protein